MKQTDDVADFIWYNKDIRINNKIVYCRNMMDCGLWTLHDLFDSNGAVISFETWRARGVHRKYFILWRGLISAYDS